MDVKISVSVLEIVDIIIVGAITVWNRYGKVVSVCACFHGESTSAAKANGGECIISVMNNKL